MCSLDNLSLSLLDLLLDRIQLSASPQPTDEHRLNYDCGSIRNTAARVNNDDHPFLGDTNRSECSVQHIIIPAFDWMSFCIVSNIYFGTFFHLLFFVDKYIYSLIHLFQPPTTTTEFLSCTSPLLIPCDKIHRCTH